MTTSQAPYLCLEDRKALKLIQRIERKLKEKPPKPKGPKPLTN